MEKKYVLCGPQAVGKTRRAESIASALKCQFIQDDWNGRDPLRAGTLAITNTEYTMPEGGVAFHIEDEAGLEALLEMLGGASTQRCRQAYSTGFYSCSCGASNKDECICKRRITALSGVTNPTDYGLPE